MDETKDIDNPLKLFQKLVLNTDKKEDKPHNIRIKNYNRNEPKIKEDKRFTPKQKYRVYKTKIEPKLLNKITVEDIDDIVAELKKAFASKDKDTSVNITELPENENNRTSFGGLSGINEISHEDAVNLTGFESPRPENQDLVDNYMFQLRRKNEDPRLMIKNFLLTDDNYGASLIQAGVRRKVAQQGQRLKSESASILQGAIKRNLIEQQGLKQKYKNEAFKEMIKKPITFTPERRRSLSDSDFSLATSRTLASQAETMVARPRGRPTNASKGLPTKKPPKNK